MRGLKYLIYIKWKAQVRNIFSKPVSAAFTLLAVVIFAAAVILTILLGSAAGTLQFIGGIENFIMSTLGYTALYFLLSYVQRRTAVVGHTDAFYLFGGPFSRKQVLAFILFEMVRGCVFYTLIIAFTFSIICAGFHIPVSLLFLSTVGYFLLFYTILSGSVLFYLLEITGKHGRSIKLFAVGMVGLAAAAVLFLNIQENGYAMKEGFKAFTSDDRFFTIPLFGWLKCLMISAVRGNLTGVVTSFFLLLSVALVTTFLVFLVKGDFQEQVVADAQWYVKTREAAKSGRDVSVKTSKIRKIGKLNFKEGAWSVTSKTILEMKKSNSWIRKQELFLIGFYLVFAKVGSQSYTTFQSLIMIVVFISASSDTMKSELKNHYIYMIPDKPIKKIFSITAPAMLKAFLIILCSVIPSAFLYGRSLAEALYSILTLTGYSVVFVAGNIWSIKVLKSGSNTLAEQFMKILIILAGCIPSIILLLVLNIFLLSSEYLTLITSFVTMGMNLIVGFFFIGMAKGIFCRGSGMVK